MPACRRRRSFADAPSTICAVHYPIPLPWQPLYAGAATCPVAEALAASVLSIPVHPNVTDEERAYVARTINGVI